MRAEARFFFIDGRLDSVRFDVLRLGISCYLSTRAAGRGQLSMTKGCAVNPRRRERVDSPSVPRERALPAVGNEIESILRLEIEPGCLKSGSGRVAAACKGNGGFSE
jgi:hypothetical protein